MSCGFDAFGERDAALLAHARGCAECARVLAVLGTCAEAWRSEVADDEVRATFRERRLGRPSWKRPATRGAWTAVFFAGLGVASAWGFERVHAWRIAAPPSATERGVTPRLAPPSPAWPPSASVGPIVAEPAQVAPAASPRPQEARTTQRAPAVAAGQAADDLWKAALRRMDDGDRAAATRLFRRVIDAPDASAALRRRATFRWAELLLAAGDTTTPRDALRRLAEAPDPAIAFDAAVLLERSLPGERQEIWERYLATHPQGPLSDEALAHQGGR